MQHVQCQTAFLARDCNATLPAGLQTSFISSQDVLYAKDRKISQLQTQLATQAAMLAAVEQQMKGKLAARVGVAGGFERAACRHAWGGQLSVRCQGTA